ncbi:hypothetical protein NP493_1574g00008 [Ridgeia piscesae]|uniref:Uncharacterized protein n=1 Tax=Ridgeia piscesae TaxID=27915 RepID=A0AAD9JYV7_RIDPI|nr:hypothetical protein NP493_1574g00008 [Ridgeia piscesae]
MRTEIQQREKTTHEMDENRDTTEREDHTQDG